MAIRYRTVVTLLLVVTSVSVVGSTTAAGPGPTGIDIAPRVAPTLATVSVSGSGCNSNVEVVETAFLAFVVPITGTAQTVTPASSGEWSAVFPMPQAPAYVIATCDGVSSSPIAVAPNDVLVGDLIYSSLTLTDVVITTSPLVDGSEFAIFDPSGNVLGTTLAAFGTATVHLPRSLGPAQVIAVGLRQQDPGIPQLPYVPIARRIQLPLPTQTSVVAEPRVTNVGGSATVSGNCSGSPRLIVTAQAAGWYDIPPVFLDTVLATDLSGSWTTSLTMPKVPSTVNVLCTQGNVTESAATLISPAEGLMSLIGQRDGSGVIVTIPNAISPERMAAFTSTGATVPIAILGNVTGGVQVRVEPSGIPVRIVIVGIESLGENANARQTSRVQGWSVDVGTIAGAASISGLAPARRGSVLGTACRPQPAIRIPLP